MITITKIAPKDYADRLTYIDNLVYTDNLAYADSGEESRIKKFPESFIFMKDGDDIVGYTEWFPISGDLKRRVENTEVIIDNEITGAEIGWPNQGETLDLFILSVVVMKGYGLFIKRMLKRLFNDVAQSDYSLGNIYAFGVSTGGERVMEKVGMTKVRVVKGGVLYKGKLSEIVI